MSGDVPKKPGLRYSDSPHAPDWARHPSEHKPKPPPEPDAPFRPSVEWFEELLWKEASEDVRVYAIVDGYWAKGLYGRLVASPDISWAHIFQGDVALNNIQDAPFIIALQRGHKLLRWLIEEGWGDGWGIYFTASTKAALERYGKTTRLPPDTAPSNEERVKLCNLVGGMEDPLWLMRRHFRMFSDVEFEDDGRVVDFRYYDPATLRVYLPSCNNIELFRFCGPIRSFYAEGYSEIEAANHSQNIYCFSAYFDHHAPLARQLECQNPPMIYEGSWMDMVLGHQIDVPRLAASEGKPDRRGGIYPMIRTEQKDAFSFSQMHGFTEKMMVNMWELLSALKWTAQPGKLRFFIEHQLITALKHSLKTEAELLAFVTCAVVMGAGFERTNAKVAALLKENMDKHTEEIAQKLTWFAKAHLNREA